MSKKKPTVADLMAKIEALEAEIKALKEAPREQHNHFHTHYDAPRLPDYSQPWWPTPIWMAAGDGTAAKPADYGVSS